MTNQLIVACVAAPSGYSVVCLEHQSKGYQNGYSYQSIKLSSFICVAQAGKNNFHQRALHAIPSILRPSNRLSKKIPNPQQGKRRNFSGSGFFCLQWVSEIQIITAMIRLSGCHPQWKGVKLSIVPYQSGLYCLVETHHWSDSTQTPLKVCQ